MEMSRAGSKTTNMIAHALATMRYHASLGGNATLKHKDPPQRHY